MCDDPFRIRQPTWNRKAGKFGKRPPRLLPDLPDLPVQSLGPSTVSGFGRCLVLRPRRGRISRLGTGGSTFAGGCGRAPRRGGDPGAAAGQPGQCAAGRRHDRAALGGASQRRGYRAVPPRGGGKPEGGEPLRPHAARARLHERPRGHRPATARRRRRSQRHAPGRRNRPHDRGPHRPRGGGEGALGAWRQRRRPVAAGADRPHVGGGGWTRGRGGDVDCGGGRFPHAVVVGLHADALRRAGRTLRRGAGAAQGRRGRERGDAAGANRRQAAAERLERADDRDRKRTL